jgi:hypothetical protein
MGRSATVDDLAEYGQFQTVAVVLQSSWKLPFAVHAGVSSDRLTCSLCGG